MNKSRIILLLLLVLQLLTSCYSHKPKASEALAAQKTYSDEQLDSISFFSKHHYTENFNFVVKSDSLVITSAQPEEKINNLVTDSFNIYKHEHIVVADIQIIPTDTVDSVWVQVASENSQFGWIQESKLIPNVVPDDVISQFISIFSDIHLLIFLIFLSIIAFVYLMRSLNRRNANIVHFRDINSFYPAALCMLVAASATLYATIQTFEPDMWRHFYFHPTLNPFSVPTILSIFLCSVWAMLIIGLAVVNEVRNLLPFGDAILYLLGVLAVCAVNYIIFSITTLYYIGYLLLLLYIWWAIKQLKKFLI